ncbi:MAG: hypothetical protein IKS20_10805 [Victivallales bacterium]|nr:hypothetical protein [Victivallales bacterium]
MKEDFIWSLERQAIFMRCPRAYFHLRSQDDAIARQLSHLQTLEAWTGNMICRSLAQALAQCASNGQMPGKEELQQIALKNMRESWMEYLNGAWKEQPETSTNIFELYYGNGKEYGTLRKLPQEATDNAKQQILDAMDTFHFSPFIKSISALDKSTWSFPSKKDTFRLDDINVQEPPDFIYKEKDGTLTTLFWTLGNEERAFLRLKQACHKMFAMEKYSLPANQVNVSTVFLNDGGRGRSFIVTEGDLATARQQILKGAEAMLAKEKSSQAKDDYLPRPEDSCQNCNFKRLCLDD